jgi:hypothetical protein
MKKISLFFLFLISISCTKKTDEEALYRDRIVALKEQINKPEKYFIYFYYHNLDIKSNYKVLIDSASNKETVIKNLSIIANTKVYDISKINGMSWFSKYENQEPKTTRMEIVFIK